MIPQRRKLPAVITAILAVITHPRLVKFTSDKGGTLAKWRFHPSALSSVTARTFPAGEEKVSRIISAIRISFIGRQM